MERITDVRPTTDLRVSLSFTDGLEREVDLEPLMRGPVFDALKEDRELFRAVQLDPRLGTIVWPNNADLDPDVLYALASGRSMDEIMVEEPAHRD